MKVVIVGGGFGGVYAARELLDDFEVVMLNKTNYFLFTPLLHEVAVGELNRHNVVEPLREILKHPNFTFIRAEADRIDAKEKKVYYEGGSMNVDYDYLIVAIGSKTNYYSAKNAYKNTMSLKTLNDAVSIRNSIIESLECATISDNEAYMNFVVIGAGATGVQLVSSIADFVHENIEKNYPMLKKEDTKIFLLQALDDILTMFEPKNRKNVEKKLIEKGVIVLKDTPVSEVTEEAAITKDRKIEATTIVWAGGIEPNDIKTVPRLQDEKGYFPVDKYLRVRKGIFAVGDCAKMKKGYPALAQVAMTQGSLAAKNIRRSYRKEKLEPYDYKLKGVLVSVGDMYAVGELHVGNKTIGVKGRLLWFVKRHIYLTNLVGLQNKIRAGMDWFLNLIFPRDTSEI